MAKAAAGNSEGDLKALTDCMYFTNGNCKLNEKCRYRHCREAAAQTKTCFKWPRSCRDVKCTYRHPAVPKAADKKKKSTSESPVVNSTSPQATPPSPTQTPSMPSQATAAPLRKEGIISFFWDIENVPIPKAQKPFDIVQRIREKLVVQSGLREYSFSCYCNSTTISQDNQLSLFHANVRIVHIPDRKPGAVDRQIMLELDRFERAHQPPATIVLISGDIDFVGKLSDLRHQAGFHVIVIHNKPAKIELKATVNAHYAWDIFTQPTNGVKNNLEVLPDELGPRTPQPYRGNNVAAATNSPKPEASPKATNAARKNRSAAAKKQTFSCPVCQSEFDSIQSLRQHQDAKSHLFECPVCKQTFVTSDGQIQHQKDKGHFEDAYVCLTCDRRFAKMDSLNQHQQATKHNGFVGSGSAGLDEVFFRPIVPPMTASSVPLMFPPPPVIPTVVPPPVVTTSQARTDAIEDAAMLVIQKGIDALAQYYPKIFPGNK